MMTDLAEAQANFNSAASRLPTLFSIALEAVQVLDLLEQAETGECDGAELDQRLEEISAILAQKAERCAWVIRDLESLAESRKTEARSLRDQADQLDRAASRMRLGLQHVMESTGQEKLVTRRYTLSIRQNPPHVEVLDSSLVPSEFQRTKVIVEPDKTAIRDHWKATGEIASGCDIQRGTRLEIR